MNFPRNSLELEYNDGFTECSNTLRLSINRFYFLDPLSDSEDTCWTVTPCVPVSSFQKTLLLPTNSPLMPGAVCCLETSIDLNHTSRFHVPDASNLDIQLVKNSAPSSRCMKWLFFNSCFIRVPGTCLSAARLATRGAFLSPSCLTGTRQSRVPLCRSCAALHNNKKS